MKKFIDPIANGGAPMFSDNVVGPVFKDIYAAIESVLSNVSAETQGVIVKGCVVTNVGGSNYSCTSGIVYLNGKFLDFAGFTSLTLPRYIVQANDVNSSFPFFDGSSNDLLVTQSATHQNTIPGSQYVAVTNTSPKSLLNYISPQVAASIAGKVSKSGDSMSGTLDMNDNPLVNVPDPTLAKDGANRQWTLAQVSSEASARSAADVILQNNINSNLLPSLDWTDIPFGANGDGTGSNIVQRAQYSIDKFGYVHLRGRVRSNAANTVGSTPVLTIPSGGRPTLNQLYVCANIINDLFGAFSAINIQIATSGDITVTNSSNDILVLDGITFRV